MKEKKVFCANEQAETIHQVVIDTNGDFVFSCECGRFFKLPEGVDVKEALVAHEEANKGQKSIEAIEQENAEKLKLLDDSE